MVSRDEHKSTRCSRNRARPEIRSQASRGLNVASMEFMFESTRMVANSGVTGTKTK